jgi:hypothetical protein
MVGIPEISGPQEREREGNVENNPQRERLDHGDVHSPKWGTQFSPGESELQPSTRVFKEMRERPQLCVRGGFTKRERTLRED